MSTEETKKKKSNPVQQRVKSKQATRREAARRTYSATLIHFHFDFLLENDCFLLQQVDHQIVLHHGHCRWSRFEVVNIVRLRSEQK
jgi:hypothetical protein